MNTTIWTVTAARLEGDDAWRTSRTRMWGYYFTEVEAITGLHRSCDSEAGYYTHAIIENFEPGIYVQTLSESWFMWADGWVACDKPASEEHIINYAFG